MFLDITDTGFFSGMYQPIVDSVSVNGKKYGIPMEAYSIGIIYNKDVFERFGLSVPKTTEELEAVCNVLHANGIYSFANNFHEKYVSRSLVLDAELAPYMYQHPELYSDMAEKGLKPSSYPFFSNCIDRFVWKIQYSANDPGNTDLVDSLARIADGSAAMLILYHIDVSGILSFNPSANIGFFANPVSARESGNLLFVDTELCVLASAQSKNKEACLSFLHTPLPKKDSLHTLKIPFMGFRAGGLTKRICIPL